MRDLIRNAMSWFRKWPKRDWTLRSRTHGQCPERYHQIYHRQTWQRRKLPLQTWIRQGVARPVELVKKRPVTRSK
ncbi:hypothetical protein PhCBS80983_g01271 [Powellomyces hirtus]|uniref:Uncharacterized protein n=1 Tax=Powellomyces hirtus TaxID=109895 RepID=A0A507EDK2_9FUNG|nr:hypothetical protein PhCBS80983_g01271 [Powellomyces hirtus]